MVFEAVRETHAKLKKNINRLVGIRMTPPSVAKIEVLLDLVEHFAVDNPTITSTCTCLATTSAAACFGCPSSRIKSSWTALQSACSI